MATNIAASPDTTATTSLDVYRKFLAKECERNVIVKTEEKMGAGKEASARLIGSEFARMPFVYTGLGNVRAGSDRHGELSRGGSSESWAVTHVTRN